MAVYNVVTVFEQTISIYIEFFWFSSSRNLDSWVSYYFLVVCHDNLLYFYIQIPYKFTLLTDSNKSFHRLFYKLYLWQKMSLFGIGSQLLSGLSRYKAFYNQCYYFIFVHLLVFCSRLAFQPISGLTAVINQSRSISLTTALANVRCHFPRPNEIKRIKRHGWKTRLSTKDGRRILMRRILKNRYVLSH